MNWFFTHHTWGFDVGAFQFRARWFKPGMCFFHTDPYCWYLFIGPFELSGHV